VRELEGEHHTTHNHPTTPVSVRTSNSLHRTLSLCSKKDLPFLPDDAARALLFG
jgi:hypothetical protein